MTVHKMAVFVGASNSVFMSRTRDVLCAKGISVSIIDPYALHKPITGGGLISKLWRMYQRFSTTRLAVKSQSAEQTAVVHYLSLDSFWLIPLLSRHFRRVVGVAYGSDVLRRKKSLDWLLRIGLKRLDGVAATNGNVLAALIADFPFVARNDRRIIRFGLPVFDALDALENVTCQQAKAQLGFAENKCLVSLGYSASSGQRQLELIKFFSERAVDFSDVQFVIPVQYGSPEIMQAVQAECSKVNTHLGRDQYLALTEFHDAETSALMRRATDVLVNHSISDAFSGTVQEVVYAGNLVLAAEHLPYATMPGFGSAIRPYMNLDDAARMLKQDALVAWKKEAETFKVSNRAQLHATSSWDAVFSDWQAWLTGCKK